MIHNYSVEIDWFSRHFGGMTTDIVSYICEGIYAVSRIIADWKTHALQQSIHLNPLKIYEP